VSARAAARTAPCGQAEARIRIADARAQLQLSQLATTSSEPEEAKAGISCAVLAGIAAADAACCKALGRTNRSQSHHDAVALLGQVEPGGDDAAKHLQRLLALKEESQYGFGVVGGQKLTQAQRRAESLVGFAEGVLRR
jgi:hypothetical protein